MDLFTLLAVSLYSAVIIGMWFLLWTSWMFGNLGILSIYIWASTDCLVLMPFIFNLFLLDSILYIAARSSSTTGLLSSWTYNGSYCFKANIHIFGISMNFSDSFLPQFSLLIHKLFHPNKAGHFLSSSSYLFPQSFPMCSPSTQNLHFFQYSYRVS